MTDTDKQQFSQAFNRLAVATRLPANEGDAAMKRIYFEGLSDLPVEAVTLAAAELETKADWFPKVKEWRERARKHETVLKVKALPAPREEPWHSECPACDDTGWEIKRCFPDHPVTCGVERCKKQKEHTYAVRCYCIETNRTYQRNRAHLNKSQR